MQYINADRLLTEDTDSVVFCFSKQFASKEHQDYQMEKLGDVISRENSNYSVIRITNV